MERIVYYEINWGPSLAKTKMIGQKYIETLAEAEQVIREKTESAGQDPTGYWKNLAEKATIERVIELRETINRNSKFMAHNTPSMQAIKAETCQAANIRIIKGRYHYVNTEQKIMTIGRPSIDSLESYISTMRFDSGTLSLMADRYKENFNDQ